MERIDTVRSNAHDDHEVRNASVISGALLGATAGILGGVVGVGMGGIAGATIGALGGFALERKLRRLDARVDHERDDAIAAALIEPPCPDCVEARASSGDALAWCARHGRRHGGARHLHYSYPPSFGVGSMLLRPTF